MKPTLSWLLPVCFWGALGWVLGAPAQATLNLTPRRLLVSDGSRADGRQGQASVRWDPRRTAVIICDMWDKHWCRGATERVAEMAPRMNQVIQEMRRRGVLIIHSPSDTMKFYQDHPARQLAQSAPPVELKVKPEGWCALDGQREPPLPIEVVNEGCDDTPPCAPPKGVPYPWTRQIAALEIQAGDAITDNAEALYLMKQRGITHVILMGVHANMCVLGRPFGIRQLVYQGFEVLLMRDLTDAMYCSRGKPQVDHFRGNDLVIAHIEKFWCPSITSDQVIGGTPFEFSQDPRASSARRP